MRSITALFLTFCFSLSLSSQSLKETTADKYYDMLAFSKAATYYKELATIKNARPRNIRRAAECYRYINDHKHAVVFYEKLNNLSISIATEADVYAYFQELKYTGDYIKANQTLQKLRNLPQYASIIKRHDDNENYYINLKTDSSQYTIKDAGINTEESEFSPFITMGDVYFSSNRRNVATVNKKFAWDDTYFLDEYKGKYENGSFKDIKPLSKTIDSRYHEGPAVVSPDNKIMYITRTNYIDRKLGYDTKKQVNIKLFISRKNDKGEWGKVENFPFNSDDYSTGHPALSKDGNTLYFVSDMPGGFGQTDIYKTNFVNGTWTKPENLGGTINTKGKEMFPYVYDDFTLFFSSDGYAGLGGLDLYISAIEQGHVKEVKNLGYPVNTRYDDFGIHLNADTKTGYLSSNRSGGKGEDDIYAFESKVPLVSQFELKGIVSDKYSGQPLANVSIDLYDESHKVIATIKTDNAGFYKLPLSENKEYVTEGARADYAKNSFTFSTKKSDSKKINGDMVLQPEGIYSLSGLVTDNKTKQAVQNVEINIKDKTTGALLLNLLTTSNGGFEKLLSNAKPGESLNYVIELQKAGYMTKTILFSKTLGQPEIINLNAVIDLSLTQTPMGAENIMVINPIFFDLDKSTIRPDAEVELDKLAGTLKQQHDLKIEITSYTDCRATEQYNMNLSQRRAYATLNYLAEKGIDRNRLKLKWVGETELTVNCACEPTNESSCSEEQHQLNRRSNFKVLGQKINSLSSK
jgi:outer membrane protein OmpA-like peptidoglycan-associated protein/tetratricopeptide (TPR) repeat protein